MRDLADAQRVRTLMRELGRSARAPASIYFTGGATAVLHAWRGTTVDVDLRIEPEHDALFRSLAELKERLRVNIELASPEDFVPVMADWRSRSPFIQREGAISFHHFDPHAQALAKAERSHAQDVADVQAMLALGLVTPPSMWSYFEQVAERLVRYPALDRRALERSLASLFGAKTGTGGRAESRDPS